MKRWMLVAGVALASCTGFDAVQRNVCGNGLIEPGEDCDSSEASCVRCAVACSRSSECPTTDYTCGNDGLCHAPGGALGQPVQAGSFLVDDFAITDVDHDGAGDVLGFSKTSILVRHGDAGGRLARSETQFTPSQSGPPALGDLDDDGALDVALATPDGLVTYTSAFGQLSPLDVQSTISSAAGAPLDLRALFRISPLTMGVLVADHGQLYLGAVDFLAPDHPVIQAPCGARIGAVDPASWAPGSIDVYPVSRETDVATDVVVALTLGAGASAKLCVIDIHKDNLLAAAVLTDITPPGAAPPASRPVLADLDGNTDRCPGLVNVDAGAAALRYWGGQLAGAHCVLKAAAGAAGDLLPPITAASPGAAVIGRIPVDPVVPFVVADALVLSDGVYALVPGLASYQALYRTTRRLAHVASADLDGDGAIDAVLSAQGDADLDVLIRSISPPGFQLLRLDTASEATTLTLGDYDGNGIADIAYTEAIGSHQRLMISYGTADRPLAPIEVGELPSIAGITRVQLPDSIDPLSLSADLAVLQAPSGGGGATLTLLHGSPNRTMMPYFDPRPTAAREAGGAFRGTVIGRFTGPGPAHRGIMALAPASASAAVQAFRVAGTGVGLESAPAVGAAVGGLAECGGGGASADLCVGNAALFAWPRSPTHDVVLAIDRQPAPHAGVFDPAAAPITMTAVPALTAKIPVNSALVARYAADLDGDGANELVAAFAPGAAADRGAILVCQVTDGLPASCDDVVPAILAAWPATHACSDAAPGQLGYRDRMISASPGRDLVVLCQDGGSTLYRVRRTPAGFAVEPLVHTTSPLAAIRVGDVTGDGLADIVGLEGVVGARSLVVYPQCSSRELERCRPGSTATTAAGGGS
jgi:hypothetical protein